MWDMIIVYRVNRLPNMVETVQERLNKDYRFLEYDLSEERDFEEVELEFPYNELIVVSAPSAFTLYINDKNEDAIDISSGESISIKNFEIRRLFISNSAGSGTAKIWLASRR